MGKSHLQRFGLILLVIVAVGFAACFLVWNRVHQIQIESISVQGQSTNVILAKNIIPPYLAGIPLFEGSDVITNKYTLDSSGLHYEYSFYTPAPVSTDFLNTYYSENLRRASWEVRAADNQNVRAERQGRRVLITYLTADNATRVTIFMDINNPQ